MSKRSVVAPVKQTNELGKVVAANRTMSGLPLAELYEPAGGAPPTVGRPGEYPYTRGVYDTMYRGRLWTMRMFAGFGTPEQTNTRFHALLKAGQTGLSTAFDMPTLMGRDPDDPLSLGEVGREGVSIGTVDDMTRLFAGIPLDQVSTSMTINASASVALAFYVLAAERQGVSPNKLRGTIQNDMLKEFIAQKEWVTGVKPSMRIIRDMFVWCSKEMPLFHPVSISGYHIREAGATAVQELAFTLADGIGYVQCGLEAGLDVDAFAPRLSFFFDVHNDFFEEVAKLRAARRIWARVMKERFKAKSAKSLLMRTHCQTAGVSLTAQQPLNNVARVAVQALAAVFGGTQSLHTNSMDETYALPTELAATVALRTQQIIADETGVAKVIDPLAGSYFVEALTDRMEQAATAIIDKIDAMGGIVEAVEAGYPQREIATSAYEFQRRVEANEEIVVGVNRYVDGVKHSSIPTLKIDHDVEIGQIDAIKACREKRDAKAAKAAIDKVRAACHTGDNLMPRLLDAGRAGCTLGELCNVYREVFGEYRDPGGF
ncbi:MAG: methylmalonyl-CoA mutase [Deltaproteobacteria bacterium]|nr:methylmalonyl-CoA mutase [Deltaproteobacteria bacterium]